MEQSISPIDDIYLLSEIIDDLENSDSLAETIRENMYSLLYYYKEFIEKSERIKFKKEILEVLEKIDDLREELAEKNEGQDDVQNHYEDLCLFRSFFACQTWKKIRKTINASSYSGDDVCSEHDDICKDISENLKFLLTSCILIESENCNSLLIPFIYQLIDSSKTNYDNCREKNKKLNPTYNFFLKRIEKLICNHYSMQIDNKIGEIRRNSFLAHGGFILNLEKIDINKIEEVIVQTQAIAICNIYESIKNLERCLKRNDA
ncbi:hypothetical protein [Acidianus manzaensis]|uniref:Uncharacterized protein n=1 Tax=Acidianus manzaensis TaxID=282676 RepID=A0A1W6JWC8_9CREN|nr:hypothetical protein [Acidianus manzaensis]ARM74596.1 hypothetical protein B6F84_00160 [Acidianus manzaensis]